MYNCERGYGKRGYGENILIELCARVVLRDIAARGR